jgi:hypothetical protein
VYRLRRSHLAYAAAPWILAGGLLLASPPVAAQDDSTAVETDDDTDDNDDGTTITIGGTGGATEGTTATALPRTGAGLTGGAEASWLSLGAIAGAAVAAVYAARERSSNRK